MSNKSNNSINIPQAREAMDNFNMRRIQRNWSQLVKKMLPVRTASYTRADRTAMGHTVQVRYIVGLTV